MDQPSQSPEVKSLPTTTSTAPVPSEEAGERKVLIGVVVGVIILVVVFGAALYFLVQPTTDTAKIRDIFIIFMALESLLIGLTLVILIIQIARLINLLQNEVKPILESTNETVSSLRGTTTFLSDNLVQPVIKLNEYLAGLTQFIQVIGLTRGKPKNKKQGE
ncbi:MAG: hypothetical protein P8Z00_22295 [Anaerolineales bacterium]|jgi:hypothetical protein